MMKSATESDGLNSVPWWKSRRGREEKGPGSNRELSLGRSLGFCSCLLVGSGDDSYIGKRADIEDKRSWV